MGLTFVLNRETGEPVWPVEERPVPQDPVPGEYLSSTQPFPTHVPHMIQTPLTADDAWGFTFWDEGVCRDQIETLRNEGIYTPPSLEGSVFFPGNGGGNNWGSPAVDPRTGLTILVTMRYPSSVRLTPREECEASGSGGQQLGTPYCAVVDQLSSPLGMPCTRPPWGTLDALDLVAGKVRWSVPLGTTRNIAPFPFWWIEGTPAIGGPMLTAGGLVFVAASLDHQFRAFDVSTGEVLWQAEMPTTANSSPMTYQLANGRQYVVIASGSHWGGFSEPGDHLIAYALPE
jgi:quinoprotein glucose dehydrogenase